MLIKKKGKDSIDYTTASQSTNDIEPYESKSPTTDQKPILSTLESENPQHDK